MTRPRTGIVAGTAAAVTVLAIVLGAATGWRDEHADTRADYGPGRAFEPLAESSACVGAPGGIDSEPFAVPPGYRQRVLAAQPEPHVDAWDMVTQNQTGRDAGRYVYQTHELGSHAAVSVVDLKSGDARLLAQRPDWEVLDGLVWTPWGTLLAAEETRFANQPDPDFPQAGAGLVYELFLDPDAPGRLAAGHPLDDVPPLDDGIAVRPALGSKSHEGMGFDARGNLYGISESSPGSIFRFVPDRKGELRSGALQALRSVDGNGHDGEAEWVDIPRAEAVTDAQSAADGLGANGYVRPEDVETGQSSGRDVNNRGHTVYVSITGSNSSPGQSGDEVLAIDVSRPDLPYVYDYAFNRQHSPTLPDVAPNAGSDFDHPDNLALDRKGNLAILEDPSSNPVGADVWIAPPPRPADRRRQRARRHVPARAVERFASLKDCVAEPTGAYFALRGTGRWTKRANGRSLLIHRQHAGDSSGDDQLVAITPQK